MKIKLCNIHKMTLANEGEERKPIHIPFGTWDYDETITQTLDKPHAEAMANELAEQIAAGEPGIPVYQGHPDVPEYAGKYPDKGALGWVKKIMVNEDGMDLFVDWDRDPGKGFGWFSPYWVGDRPTVGSGGKKNVIVDGLNSIGLVNNPNIREFRLANEAQPEKPAFELPAHIAALAKRFDDRKAMANVIDANGMGHSDENGQFDGSGSGKGGGGGSLEETRGKLQKMLKHEAISVAAGGNPATASKDAVHFEYRGKRYYVGKDSDHMVKQFEDAGLVKRVNAGTGGGGSSQSARLDRMLGEARNGIAKAKENVTASKARQSAAGKERAELESRLAEIRKKRTELKDFNDRMEARLKGASAAKPSGGKSAVEERARKNAATDKKWMRGWSRSEKANYFNDALQRHKRNYSAIKPEMKGDYVKDFKALHKEAILMGLTYLPKVRGYV